MSEPDPSLQVAAPRSLFASDADHCEFAYKQGYVSPNLFANPYGEGGDAYGPDSPKNMWLHGRADRHEEIGTGLVVGEEWPDEIAAFLAIHDLTPKDTTGDGG